LNPAPQASIPLGGTIRADTNCYFIAWPVRANFTFEPKHPFTHQAAFPKATRIKRLDRAQ